jgi:hypothetical protein
VAVAVVELLAVIILFPEAALAQEVVVQFILDMAELPP